MSSKEVTLPEIPMPKFDQLADLYWQLGVMQSPSQLHGYLVGRLSSGDKVEIDIWLAQAVDFIDAVEPPSDEGNLLLNELFVATSLGLDSEELSFQLLLPADEVEIHFRVDSLGQWCQGFMAGFAQGGKQIQAEHGQQQYSQDVSEAISDLAAISQISLTEEDIADQSEQQFFELVEYLRMASVTIYLDCQRKSKKIEGLITNDANHEHEELATTSPSALFGADKKKFH